MQKIHSQSNNNSEKLSLPSSSPIKAAGQNTLQPEKLMMNHFFVIVVSVLLNILVN